jgi:hypothetical protein
VTFTLSNHDLVDAAVELIKPIELSVDQNPREDRARHMVRIAQLLYTFWHTGDERFLYRAVETSFVATLCRSIDRRDPAEQPPRQLPSGRACQTSRASCRTYWWSATS